MIKCIVQYLNIRIEREWLYRIIQQHIQQEDEAMDCVVSLHPNKYRRKSDVRLSERTGIFIRKKKLHHLPVSPSGSRWGTSTLLDETLSLEKTDDFCRSGKSIVS